MKNQNSVLIVEDEPILLEMMASAIERMGYEPIRAATVEDGIKSLSSMDCRPLCVVSDFEIGDHKMGGAEIARATRVRFDCPVILATGNLIDETLKLACQADEYLQKPSGLVHLRETILRLLASKQALAA